jgi:hypothetical protein
LSHFLKAMNKKAQRTAQKTKDMFKINVNKNKLCFCSGQQKILQASCM